MEPGPKRKERLAEIWDVPRLVDIDKEPDHLIIKIYADENNFISNVVVENMNGLKTYGTRREQND